jgi:protein-L-isoaspartate(D-aspartate) O-methyltransferase
MDSLEDLISYMKEVGHLKSKKLELALRTVPRELFVPRGTKKAAYVDSPLHIGFDQTISQPSTVVIMTQALDVKPSNKILEIGAGSGWQAALLGRLAKNGEVHTVERLDALVKLARNNLKKARVRNVKVYKGDGSLGLKDHAPYDRIIVTAGCPEVPEALIEQLKPSGKMVIPVGGRNAQRMLILTKSKKGIVKKHIGTFVFVPLIGKKAF